MRSDYALYTVAVICFILAAIVFAIDLGLTGDVQMATTAVLAILGLISAGAGYLVRPEEMIPPPSPRPPPPVPSAPPLKPPPKVKTTPPIEITKVTGIGPKRAEKLRAMGISTAQDLAKSSATLLAANTGVSPKITRTWVREAKKLVKETA
jgi:hypothetical protein